MTPPEGANARIGPYQVLTELGRGGMGRVFLAAGPDGRLVAVKQIDPTYAADAGFRGRFWREVDASRRVSGAHTAAVIDADPQAPVPWLASEYVPGPSLQEAVDATGPLPAESAVRLAARLASALADIHRVGLVHRDLKPSNVLLTDDGPRVIDFGIARAVDNDSDTELTRAGWFVGAPGYMSPEQVQGRPVTAASDMFSLGVVLVVACTGSNPFVVPKDITETLRNIVHRRPDLAQLPEQLRAIVTRCLAKKPDRRPSPAQFVDALGQVRPSVRPWPAVVHHLIAGQQADLDRLLNPAAAELPPAGPADPAAPPDLDPAATAGVPAPGRTARDSTLYQNRTHHDTRLLDTRLQEGVERSSGFRPKLVVTVFAGGVVLALAATLGVHQRWLRWPTAGHGRLDPASQQESGSASPQPDGQQTSTADPVKPTTGTISGYLDRCLDVAGGDTANGTPVLIYTCHGQENQQWTHETDGTLRSLGKCLDVTGGDTANGTKVQLYDCNGTGAQQWIARDGQLINSKSARCLDVTGFSTQDGTPLQIWDCSGGANQQWHLPS